MDVNMPVMNGYDATRSIRSRSDQHAGLPILALTANTLPEDTARCIDAGMDAVLTKPVRIADLYAELKRYCDRSREEREPENSTDAAGRVEPGPPADIG